MENDSKAAFIRQFCRQQHSIAEFVRYLVPQPQDAEDVFQELVVVIMTKDAADLPTADKCGAYCRGIAKNLVRQYWRRKKTQKVVFSNELCDAIELAYEEADADHDVWDARREALDACMEQLPQESRALLKEHYVHGVRITNIAIRIEKTADALRVVLMRIRAILLDCVNRQIEESKAS